MTKKPGLVRGGVGRGARRTAGRVPSTRSPSPTPMSRPGTVELPEPSEPGVPLASVAHSMHVDARRKLAATYDDITKYVDKCEYLFEHDEFYDKSYKSLAKTVTDLNKIGTDAQLQEREQLYQSVLDWLAGSTFSIESPTQNILNEHQLIDSSQATRDVLIKMLLGLERLRALHITIVDKGRAATELAMRQADKSDNKRQLLRMVDDSTFVWKTAAAEIVQLLRDERSKGSELEELYADKIRYLMGELEAQSSMIEELRMQIDQPRASPLKLQDLEMAHDMKAKRAKQELMSRQMKQATGGQQQTAGEDAEQDDTKSAAAVSALPDFNKQLIMTLQKELDECRRQNNAVVARGHEAAAKVRFLTEESSRKDKQIAQLQANIAKLRHEARDEQQMSAGSDERLTRQESIDQFRRRRSSKSSRGRRGRKSTTMSVELDDTEDETTASRPMNLSRLIAVAKRQQRASPGTDASPILPSQVPTTASGATAAGTSSAPPASASRKAQGTEPTTKPGKLGRGVRGRGKAAAAVQPAAAPAPVGAVRLPGADIPTSRSANITAAPSFEQLSNFWQQSSIQQWKPVDTDDASTAFTAQSAAPVHSSDNEVDMNEAIEMTKLYLAGPKTQQQQSSVKGPRRASNARQQQQQQRAVTSAANSQVPLPGESALGKAGVQQRQRADNLPPVKLAQHAGITSQPAASSKVTEWQQRAKTPAEAAKLRAARLSVALHHSDDAVSRKPGVATVTPPLSTAISFKPSPQQLQPAATTKVKPVRAKDYNLVGVNMQNLAEQAKLLEDGSASAASPRRFL